MKRKVIASLLACVMLSSIMPVYAEETDQTESAAVEEAAEAEVEASDFAKALEEKYVDPDRVYSSDVRWWLGSASATDDTLLEEIQALYDGGFRGVELCMQDDGVAADEDYAYGSEMWSHKWKLMMNKLLDLGMGVYLTSGTNWASSNVPESYMSPDDPSAMQIVIIPYYDSEGQATIEPKLVKAGESISEALEVPTVTRNNTTLLSVYAYEVNEDGEFVYDSYIDLTAEEGVITKGESETDYTINWTAPEGKEYGADATYRIIPYYTQGAYETSSPAMENCYTTNYFDKRGVEKLKEFWEDNYLNDEELNAKILEGDVQLFMDSLEIKYGSTSTEGLTWYSEDAFAEFEARKGYDIQPYLFLIQGVGEGYGQAYDPYYQCEGVYDLEDNEELRKKIINDWEDVMTQLYEENMLTPLKEWLNSVGIKTRAQISYGKSFEITEPSAYVDYPEAENLNQYNQVDIFRLHTAGAKLLNKVLSTETGGTAQVYGASYQKLLHDIYSQYAAGFQRVIWHIWTASYGYGNYSWPGYLSGMGGAMAFYRWGNRAPSSEDYDELNAHIGRIQQLMQTGNSRTDIGFVYNSWTQGMRTNGEGTEMSLSSMNWQLAHMGVHYRSTELQDNGYTYDYFSPDFLSNEEVYYDTETGTIEGAGYRALVIFQEMLDISAAEKILDLAKQGLPVVIVDGAAVETTFNDGADEDLAVVMEEMKSLDNVRVATVADGPVDYDQPDGKGYDDNVYEMLQELGVRPYAEYEGANHQLLTQSREDEDGNRYMFVYNYCSNDYHEYSILEDVQTEDHGTNIQTEIKIDGQFIPYSIDAWTGKVTQLGEYRYENGQTIFSIDLDYGNMALYAFEAVDETPLSIVSTNAASAYTVEDGLVIRMVESGDYETELSDGTVVETSAEVPEAFDITDWNLTVSSWTGNEEEGDLVRTETIDGLTTENRKTSTVKTEINVTLDTLTTWDNIPEVGQSVSGEGVYEATFDWDSSAASGAYIDFGDTLIESMKVWVNGVKVGGDVTTNPTKEVKDVGETIDNGMGEEVTLTGKEEYTGGISWTKPVADISEYLVDGENTIRIEYHSNLTNVMLSLGKIMPKAFHEGEGWAALTWWGEENGVDYRSYGPEQAVIVPFVDTEL